MNKDIDKQGSDLLQWIAVSVMGVVIIVFILDWWGLL